MSAPEPTSPRGGEARFQLPDTVRRTARQKIAVLIDTMIMDWGYFRSDWSTFNV